MLTEAACADLTAALDGELALPGTPEYDTGLRIWNDMFERAPAAIARCRGEDDVVRALDAARAAGLDVSIKGGGHNIAGTALGDGALTIDLSAMRGVRVDPERRLAEVEGGATWADFDAAAQRHGLAAPGGVVSSTGVAGLTLGGGFGWLARRRGLSVDNLTAARIALADGRIVTASADENPDLFWAVRGGGGNFGVATRLTFRLHPVGPEVLFGPTFFALEDAGTVLAAYGARAPSLPRDACVWANLMTAPPSPALDDRRHGAKVLTLMQFHAGDVEEGRAALATLSGGARPLGSALALRPFTEAQSFLDGAYAHGARNYWRAHNHLTLTDGLIETLLDLAPDLPTPESELMIAQLGGAVTDVPAHETAFPHRQVPFMSVPGVRWRAAAEDEAMVGWLKAASERIAAHAAPGAYVNFIAEAMGGAERAYGSNLTRLGAIKRRYDPGNLFRSNQNIPPG